MLDDLKKNILHEKKILADMRSVQTSMQADPGNQRFYVSSLRLLMRQLLLLNNAVPELLRNIAPIPKREEMKIVPDRKSMSRRVEPDKVVRMSYVSPSTREKHYITISKKDKKEFLQKLRLSEGSLSGIKKIKEKRSGVAVVKPSVFARISNKYFRKRSVKLAVPFADLGKDLKKGNVRFMLNTYLSMAMMSASIAFLVGLMIFAVLIAFSLSNFIYIFIPFALVGLVLAGFYLYPAGEADSIQKKISQELPFVTIHMAAIAGSDIEPTKIFKIVATSSEYPNVGREIRKILTQINIYGYDLVTALKNVAALTSNRKLSELLSGLATNISTGGALKNYLEKKSENFLLDYRLERQQYADLAATFMDVYISILIAAPLVLMMMFIVMNVSGLGMGGLGITTLLTLSIFGIIIVNIIFIIVLNIKQPKV